MLLEIKAVVNCVPAVFVADEQKLIVFGELKKGGRTFGILMDSTGLSSLQLIRGTRSYFLLVQEKKLLEEQDQKKKIAEEKKAKMRNAVKELREEYEQIVEMNAKTDKISQLNDGDMTIDPQYNEILENRINFEIEEVKKELEWNTAYAERKCEKLRDYMLNELQVDRLHVRALRNPNIFVQTFKVKKMSQYLRSQLEKIYEEIEEESRQQAELNDQNEERKELSPSGQQALSPSQEKHEQEQLQQQQFEDGTQKDEDKMDLKKKHKAEQEKFKKE